MKRIYLFFAAICLCAALGAQTLAPLTWTAYGLTFQAPKGILVEEDTEDTFLLNNSRFSITIETLDSEGLEKGKLTELLTGLLTDEEVKALSPVTEYDLPQFHGYYVKGTIESEPCYYALLMTKDAGNAFYLSIAYNRTDDKTVEKILKSFKLEEE